MIWISSVRGSTKWKQRIWRVVEAAICPVLLNLQNCCFTAFVGICESRGRCGGLHCGRRKFLHKILPKFAPLLDFIDIFNYPKCSMLVGWGVKSTDGAGAIVPCWLQCWQFGLTAWSKQQKSSLWRNTMNEAHCHQVRPTCVEFRVGRQSVWRPAWLSGKAPDLQTINLSSSPSKGPKFALNCCCSCRCCYWHCHWCYWCCSFVFVEWEAVLKDALYCSILFGVRDGRISAALIIDRNGPSNSRRSDHEINQFACERLTLLVCSTDRRSYSYQNQTITIISNQRQILVVIIK